MSVGVVSVAVAVCPWLVAGSDPVQERDPFFQVSVVAEQLRGTTQELFPQSSGGAHDVSLVSIAGAAAMLVWRKTKQSIVTDIKR